MPDFHTVRQFERSVAAFYGAQHGVATDCCTHAIELCLRYLRITETSCPAHTYLSVPMTLHKLDIRWLFVHDEWIDSYAFGGTPIVDAAVLWRRDSHVIGQFTCLSFQHRKHLSLGRGGMILCDSEVDASQLRLMSYDGRDAATPWMSQDVTTWGYHYYMTPETAQQGLDQLPDAINRTPRAWSWRDYADLRNMGVFTAHAEQQG